MKKGRYILMLCVIAAMMVTALSSCKKGSGDPGISFRSRAARVAGEWKVKSYSMTNNTTQTNTNNEVSKIKRTAEFDGSNFTETEIDEADQTTTTIKSTGSISYTFGKDGSWNSVVEKTYTETDTVTLADPSLTHFYDYTETTLYTIKIESAGKWDFMSGRGEAKNKENMFLEINTSTTTVVTSKSYSAIDAGAPAQANISGTQVSTDDYDSGTNTWKITTLKNKEMAIESTYDTHTAETYDGAASDFDIVVHGSESISLEAK